MRESIETFVNICKHLKCVCKNSIFFPFSYHDAETLHLRKLKKQYQLLVHEYVVANLKNEQIYYLS